MSMPSKQERWIVYARWFLASGGLLAVLASAGTAIAAYYVAPASDMEAGLNPIWNEAKYFVLDVQTGMVFTAAATLILWGMLRVLTWRLDARAVPVRGRAIATILGLLAVCVFARVIVKNHPVFVETLRVTAFPSSEAPDQITLTWADSPDTTQSIQWRTAPGSPAVTVRYRTQGATDWQTADSTNESFMAENMANDDKIEWHTARLADLQPGTGYEYEVGSETAWSETRKFTTAPAASEAFSFMYLGDSQIGLQDYGNLLDVGYEAHPEAAFVIHAGDLVNRGCDRDDWDLFFHASRNVFDQYPIMPTIGNHDDCGVEDPRLYIMYFDLPKNGSDVLSKEQTYAFTYGNALFVTLNSNLKVEEQTPWLEEQLAHSDAEWKFLLWHHPAYASRSVRDNPDVRKYWGALADKYGVDIVFQGHDHAYARSKPIHDGQVADGTIPGVIYVLAVSGTKFYDQDPNELFEVGYEKMPTYQIIHVDGKTLRYEAYDIHNKLVDDFSLTKK
ncbi:MAG: hypothetical protein GC168_07685 [Candidatus Hydrogenedens sp.]|nr:hypothetical protein [Candidatus Hydrogenedens sp.]